MSTQYSSPAVATLPASSRPASKLWFWGVALAVLGIDQATKALASAWLLPEHSLPVLGEFVQLTLLRNAGAAFSLLAHPAAASWRRIFLISVATLTLAVMIVFAYRERQAGLRWLLPLGLVSGGALGNLVDRVLSGTVVDFIDLSVLSYHWPVFNLADSAVLVGVSWLVLDSFRRPPADAGLSGPVA